MTISKKEKAGEILKILNKYFPKSFDGKESMKWLYKYSNQKIG